MITYFYITFSIFNTMLDYIFSVIIRMELESSHPSLFLIDFAQVYNVCVSFHGVVMIFFFIMPFLIGGTGNDQIPKTA